MTLGARNRGVYLPSATVGRDEDRMPLDRDSLTMERLRPIITFIIIIWVIQFANFALGYRPNIWFGLEPRDFGGLVGIPLSPLLHGGFMHAAANTVPLLILGGMAAMAAPKRFIEATLIIVLVGGALVWLMARGGNRVHVGAASSWASSPAIRRYRGNRTSSAPWPARRRPGCSAPTRVRRPM
jgi:membrane associated rhomboid family serine protease